MKLKPLGTNKTEMELNDGTRVLFSYQTPVAARKIDECGASFYRTATHYSATTTRHIKSWLPFNDAEIMGQEWFDTLVS